MDESGQELESRIGVLFSNLREKAKVDPGVQPGDNITYKGKNGSGQGRVNLVKFSCGEFFLLTEDCKLIKPEQVISSWHSDLKTEVNIGDEYTIKVKYKDKILTLVGRVLAQRSLGPGSMTYLRASNSDDICIISTAALKRKEERYLGCSGGQSF